ncbi:DUF6585 family protein [Catenuloplanes japonicus]|uniref:DUF6585 family protein n=1 Tax=Catenuloplanes japonicus TaxID=33876 RepID=UPI0012FC47EE|nr:DUF6585 family protein [Catenuloplanes japonicus]
MLPVPHSIITTAGTLGFGAVEHVCRQAWVPTFSLSLSFFGGLGALFGWATTLTTETDGIVVGAISALCLLIATYGVWDSIRLRNRRFYLCAGGLLIADRVTELRRPIAWSEVAAVRRYYLATYSGNGQELHHRCRLRLTDGTRINLERPPLSDGEVLCAAVEARVAEALLPGVAGALGRGETVRFGPIVADQHGVAHGGTRLGWEEAAGVRVRRVRVRFFRRGGGQAFSARIRDVDNLAVLLAVAAQHRITVSA